MISFFKPIKVSIKDIVDGFKRHELWLMLAKNSCVNSYKDTRFGLWWNVLHTLIFTIIVSVLYGGFFTKGGCDYVLYFMSGFIVWSILSAFTSEGCTVFTKSAGVLNEIKIPFSFFVFVMITRNVYVFLLNLLLYLLVLAITVKSFNLLTVTAALTFIPFFILTLINAVWVAFFLGVVSAYFRDVVQYVSVTLRVAFFATPIMFYADGILGFRKLFLYFNPYYYFLDALRRPLIGQFPTFQSCIFIICTTIIGYVVTLYIFGKYRNKINYWL